MKLFIFTIVVFLYTVISIKFCKLIHNEKYIKNKKVSDMILALLSLILIFLYLWTLKVDKLNFIQFNFMDSYVGFDNIYGIIKISIYIVFNISIAVFVSNLIYQIFDKNKILYYLSFFIILISLFLYNNVTKVINITSSGDKRFFAEATNSLYIIVFLVTVFLALLYDSISSNKKKKDIDDKKFDVKSLVLVVLYVIMCVGIIKGVTNFYPTYLYEKVFEDKKIDKPTNKTILMKDLKYDDVNIGDTVQFGVRRESSDNFKAIEWIVIDKDDANKKILLLSKNGIDVEQSDAIRFSIDNYDSYSSYYDGGYEYDQSDLKSVNYNNSALRFEFHECYDEFVNYNLSRESNEEYNEYKYKGNIENTYLSDTKTYENFFPLNEAEYNKYKKIKGVGNFYFINSSNYIVFRREFHPFYIALRDLREIGNGGYDFKCLSPKYTVSEYDFDESHNYAIRDNDNTILSPFWFSSVNEDDNDLWHDHIDIVLRPAMWYRCD